MNEDKERPTCPFCPFSVPSNGGDDMYFLTQHVELCHPENGESPFIAVMHDDEHDARADGKDSGPRLCVRSGRESALSTDTPSEGDSDDEGDYVECPALCGEAVNLAELSNHMELHGAEGMVVEETSERASLEAETRPDPGRSWEPAALPMDVLRNMTNLSSSASKKKPHSHHKKHRDHYGLKDWKQLLLGPGPKKPRPISAKVRHAAARRLGKSELGPHAYEEQMPLWLLKQLERGAKVSLANQIGPTGQVVRVEHVANETAGILPVLAYLCEQDPALSKVFLCHPGVKHVVKMSREGGFCGYRNIQMMISFIQATRASGSEHFPGRIPSILRLQDLIEEAWDKGINSAGRIETGGIRGTRKYIGTPEAQALLVSLGIGCEANAFNTVDKTPVYRNVLEAVAEYFLAGVTDPAQKVYKTSLPPIYFQHPGHSLTIVGLEIRRSGIMNLLVLDPMFKTSPAMIRFIGSTSRTSTPEKPLKAYRRGGDYMQKYSSFEILKLTPQLPRGAGWAT